MPITIPFNSAINELLEHRSLSRAQAECVIAQLIDESIAPEQAGAFLVALRMKGETVDEIAGFLDCLRKRAIAVTPKRADLVDVCGTGGDGSGTFNVSTAVAFVLAGAGLGVAKHGNRAVSSRSGSFDVLEALGVGFESDASVVAASIDEQGLGFMFAPAFHPSFQKIGAIRRGLGVRTVFNALGPLLNPAGVKRQLIGVYSDSLLERLAGVLRISGSTEAMVVRGEDGLDEISLSGPTRVAHLKDGQVRTYAVNPEDFGLKRSTLECLRGGDARENAGIIEGLLEGRAGPCRDVVVLNAAAALVVGGKAGDFGAGARMAEAAIDSGKARGVLRAMQGRKK
jgi:anthranilate phosphoribosyltransferase